MRSLAVLAMADLRELVRKDPSVRAAAWAEITFRNQARQAFERENFRPETIEAFNAKHGVVLSGKFDTTGRGPLTEAERRARGAHFGVVQPWVPPDLTPPEPPREGPMV